MTNIDLELVKEQADMLTLAGQDTFLKKVANTGGGEWAGPCPFCYGENRFHVQPNAKPGRWFCRNCTKGKWKDAIDYVARRDNLDLHKKGDLTTACQSLAVGTLQTQAITHVCPPEPAYAPPASEWQAAARQVINECEAVLWDPKNSKALDYLHKRGLKDETIRKFRLGYNPSGQKINVGYWLDRGITIPCEVSGEVWYLKVRRSPADITEKRPQKYSAMTGSRPAAIFNADSLAGARIGLFCEGEFDCMIALQETENIIPVVTIGSATNRLDLSTWGAYLLPLNIILSCYDRDKAGEKGTEALEELAGDRVKLLLLPDGVKDINDYFLAGGDLLDWILEPIRFWK